jgi:hypothetical protein
MQKNGSPDNLRVMLGVLFPLLVASPVLALAESDTTTGIDYGPILRPRNYLDLVQHQVKGIYAGNARLMQGEIKKHLDNYRPKSDDSPQKILHSLLLFYGSDYQAEWGAELPGVLPPTHDTRTDAERVGWFNLFIVTSTAHRMTEPDTAGQTKMTGVRRSIIDLAARMPEKGKLGIIAFGTNYSSPESKSIRPAIPVRRQAQIADEVGRLDPIECPTPLALGIQETHSEIEKVGGYGLLNVVVVITGTADEVGGDALAAARELMAGKHRAIIHVIGIDLRQTDVALLNAIADIGRGEFFRTQAAAETHRVLLSIIDGLYPHAVAAFGEAGFAAVVAEQAMFQTEHKTSAEQSNITTAVNLLKASRRLSESQAQDVLLLEDNRVRRIKSAFQAVRDEFEEKARRERAIRE